MNTLSLDLNREIVNSSYSPIQVLVAYDTWMAARAELDAALNAALIGFDPLDCSDMQATISNTIAAIVKNCPEVCPLCKRTIARHSSERYPVAKTLTEATRLSTAARKVAALEVSRD